MSDDFILYLIMSLSSNSLLHFTKNFNNLKGILTKTFKVNYCRENLKAGDKFFDILVPVVSFSDVPFSQVMHQIKAYGSYGIGLSKSWAMRNGLNPVLYVERESNIGSTFYQSLFSKISSDQISLMHMETENKNIMDIIRYMKNYEGDLERIGRKTKRNYRFSDEREWRYVLPPSNVNQLFGNCNTFYGKGEFIKILKTQLNEKIAHEYLHFGPEDVTYIIIKSERERDKTIEVIRDIKDVHGELVVSRIASKIVTVEQIKGDY